MSSVDICNLALSLLGDRASVSSIDPPDGSAQAEHCARFYPIALGAMLEAHSWNFATTRASLQAVENLDQPDSWLYTFAYPTNCARVLKLLAPGQTNENLSIPFEIEILSSGTRVILTNLEEGTVLFVKRVTDTAKFSTLFSAAFARLLAFYLAGPIIKGAAGVKVAEGQRQLWLNADLPAARDADSAQRRSDILKEYVPRGIAARA